MAHAARVYKAFPADERQEFRLPAVLKEHINRAAAQSGQSVAEYITDAVAERVTADLAASSEWFLSVDEQTALMSILIRAPTAPSTRAVEAAKRADALFGPMDRRRGR